MKIHEITSVIEETAPLALQAGFDNSGLIVGHRDAEVDAVLLCVDITEAVLDEAERMGVKFIVSHHPVIFHPIKRLTGIGYVERMVERAIRSGIALYACHTNLDAVRGGMSYRLAELLGIRNPRLLGQPNDPAFPDAGFGVIGELESPLCPVEYLRAVKGKLDLPVVRHNRLWRSEVSRIALCTGSGASLLGRACREGADIFLAADFRYNDFLDWDSSLIVADIGHFESEYCAIDLLYDIITKKLPTFAVHRSRKSVNPVNYLV